MRNVVWAEVALVAAGGALGCVARYTVGIAAGPWSAEFPWGTFGINVLGSFLLGMLVGALPPGGAARLALGTGFCGGFTTFSTFGTETVALLERGAVGRAGAYAGGSVAVGVLAAAVGAGVGRAVAR